MFDSEFAGLDDAAIVAAIEQGARAEAAAAARRLAAIAALVHRHVSDDDEDNKCAFDPWDGVAVEVAAAMTVGHRRASGQMRIAMALRDRLPQVAALFAQGTLSARIVSAITWRTQLVLDEQALALIDTALADRASRLGPLSEYRLHDALDTVVERYDPDALRTTQTSTRTRDFHVGDIDDPCATTSVWGKLLATDAAVLKRRVDAMAQGVCEHDPRTLAERRADALGALGAGDQHLRCACPSPTCKAAGPQTSNLVVHVLADPAAIDYAHTNTPQHPAEHGDAAAEQPAALTQPRGTAVILGGGALPTSLLPEVLRRGATTRPITMPGAAAETRYHPSVGLGEFVRMRDMYCRAPGCDVPADRCDIDHTIPWPLGPTHPSNLKCLCRKHHLMKTLLRRHRRLA
ncbi:HNH endonuclease signature motif containing protein [Mycolicibacterium sp. GF69]|uniref:HNH endonuclease signature motif containing protein n=1 Tax=Mycolicibacterium sp. GF69 TaxID=2267251 RepID=UPI001F0C1C95|nr:HNH endonuclease signature motif containing protein [Mycolicibacterium sp. GF69]